MPNRTTFGLCLFTFLFYATSLFAQNQNASSNKAEITTAFERYFESERESIHVHFDKNVFFSNESIWFKGYVYNKKLSLPFYETTNVYVQLIDESGIVINRQLLYSMSGFFSGRINLDKKFKSGYYYLQFYTNWMNNFEEDESFVQRIKIKNVADNEYPLAEIINTSKINITFYPEGGHLIKGVPNTVGVKVTDSNGKPLPNVALEIKDSENNVQKSVSMNAFGMGKFEFVPTDSSYKAVLNQYNAEQLLPLPDTEGISLELNNYVFDNKTLVKLKYDSGYGKAVKNKMLYLVIQKNEKSNIVDIKLNTDGGITEFFFSNELLFNGVNSVRVIDSEMNELAQRMVFVPTVKKSKINLNTAFKNEDRIELSGNSDWPDACLSSSMLPTLTKINTEENLITTLTLNSYVNEKLTIPRDYFNEINRSKRYELDLMLLTQKNNKYEWYKIKQKPNKPTYSFEKGLDIKGKIINTNADLKRSRVQLKNIISEVLASTDTIEKNEFYFRNVTVTDSLLTFCSLIDAKTREEKKMDYHLTIVNKDKKFYKNYIPVPYSYPDKKEYNAAIDLVPQINGNFIMLDDVEVKTKLKRENQNGNGFLKGFKVGVDVSENTDVLTFIEQNGFNVSRERGSISITGRVRNSINSGPTIPIVFIDGRQLFSSFEELAGLRMTELEEVYISSTAIVASIKNNLGIIKLYRKQSALKPNYTTTTSKLLVGGYEGVSAFKNADYQSEHTSGFTNFGLIHWSPWLLTDGNGNLKITIPNHGHKTAKVLIEGFMLDGTLISEIREVNLE